MNLEPVEFITAVIRSRGCAAANVEQVESVYSFTTIGVAKIPQKMHELAPVVKFESVYDPLGSPLAIVVFVIAQSQGVVTPEIVTMADKGKEGQVVHGPLPQQHAFTGIRFIKRSRWRSKKPRFRFPHFGHSLAAQRGVQIWGMRG